MPLLYNPRTGAVHDAACRWIEGAAKGSKPLDLRTFEQHPDRAKLPSTAHTVTCCTPKWP